MFAVQITYYSLEKFHGDIMPIDSSPIGMTLFHLGQGCNYERFLESRSHPFPQKSKGARFSRENDKLPLTNEIIHLINIMLRKGHGSLCKTPTKEERRKRKAKRRERYKIKFIDIRLEISDC